MRRLREHFVPRSSKVALVASLVAFMVSGALTYALMPFLNQGAQGYSDLIVGSVTWVDHYKSFDYYVIYLFLGLFYLSWAGLIPLLNRHPRLTAAEQIEIGAEAHPYIPAVVVGCVAYSLTLWILRGVFPQSEFLVTAVLASLAVLLLADSRPRGRVGLGFVAALLTSIFLYFSGIAVLAVFNAMNPGLALAHQARLMFVPKVLFILGLVAGWVVLHRDSPLAAKISRLCYLSQVPVPLLLLVVGHAVYQQGGALFPGPVPVLTWAVIDLIALAFVAHNTFLCARRSRGPEPCQVAGLVFWPTVVAIAVFLAYRPPSYTAFAWDDFHLGERLIPWEQVSRFHQSLYQDFISVKGLLGLSYGAINSSFLTGTLSSYPIAYALVVALAAGLTAFLVCRLVGTAWGLVFSAVVLPTLDRLRLYLVLPTLLILAHPGLTAHPVRWLLVWAALSLFHCLFSPSAGTALTVATLPVAAWMIISAARSGYFSTMWRSRRALTLVSLLLALVLLAWLGPVVLGWIDFMRENGSANTTAYGIGILQYGGVPPWFPHWIPRALARWAWESFRVGGWLFGGLALWHLFLRNILQSRSSAGGAGLAPGTVVALGGMLFAIALIPYSMGRIDPATLSRTGAVSVLMLGSVLPLAIVLSRSGCSRGRWVATAVGMLLAVRSAIDYQDPGALPLRAIQAIPVPMEARHVRGTKIGLPELGDGFVPPAKLDEIIRLRDILARFLKDGETYYDLTNRSAMYFVLGRRVPAAYSGDYYAANYEMQMKVVAALKRNPPPLVWIGPAIRHDGGPASLRAYRIYRWLMEQDYRYYEEAGLQFLVRPDRYLEMALPRLLDRGLAGLSRVFHLGELQSIPIAWGRNLPGLRDRFAAGDVAFHPLPEQSHSISVTGDGWLEITGGDPFVVWRLQPAISGAAFDFLTLRLKCQGAPRTPFRGQVFWAERGGHFSEEKSFRFNAAQGELLLPLGSDPKWLKAGVIERIRLDLDQFGQCKKFRVENVELLRLIK